MAGKNGKHEIHGKEEEKRKRRKRKKRRRKIADKIKPGEKTLLVYRGNSQLGKDVRNERLVLAYWA